MATPFAVFFYSVYGQPLKMLNNSSATSWLVQHIFPHFTQTSSSLISALLYISWPLMCVGFIIFVVGFIQIYGAKLLKKGPVLGGLYRCIRHPQYMGWAIFGLGMAIAWSRIIVLIMYVSMLFVYYLLAKSEERECLNKYGESYRTYLQKTGRFFPKFKRRKLDDRKPLLPETGKKRVVALIAIYVVMIFCVVRLGMWLRSYSISKISHLSEKDAAVVSTVLMSPSQMKKILTIVKNNEKAVVELKTTMGSEKKKQLIYIVPLKWRIPELAMEVEQEGHHGHGYNPTTHGNTMALHRDLYKVLYSEAVVDHGVEGKEIILKARGQKPMLLVKVDTNKKGVIGIEKPPEEGKYKDVPVPLF
jgi:protein-S-isoprenylcysteine O-methyltransferase Ste14